MKKNRPQSTPYLGLSARERRGIALFLTICALCLLLFHVITNLFPRPEPKDKVNWKHLDSLAQLLTIEQDTLEERPLRLHLFNPNSEDSIGLLDLGFSPRLAKSLLNYRRHGGKFRIKADVGKLYSITPALLSQIHPYIDLPDSLPKKVYPKLQYTAKAQPHAGYINEVDTTLLISWPMIGSGTAKRILQYRDRLGGFVDTAQYNEVWGLVPEQIAILKTYAIIEADEKPRPIYINRATASELRQHPYLNFKQVRILLNYREQHGPYRTWAELLASKALTESELSKLRPYISLEY